MAVFENGQPYTRPRGEGDEEEEEEEEEQRPHWLFLQM